MTRLILKNNAVTKIEFCDEVGYDFVTSNGSIEAVEIGAERIEPANLVNVLATVSYFFQKKNKDIKNWQESALYWKDSYKSLRTKLYIASFILVVVAAGIFFITGV